MIFVSYARSDINHVKPFVSSLEQAGLKCWLDEYNIPVGEAFVVRIADALKNASLFIVFDTNASRNSYWVLREKKAALRLKQSGVISAIASINHSDLPSDPFFRAERVFKQDGELLMDVLRFAKNIYQNQEEGTHCRDSHAVERKFIHLFPQPRNWLGRSEQLGMLDKWWRDSSLGIWINGPGGVGKSSLFQTWLMALCEIGYEVPLNLSVLTCSFYENSSVHHVSQMVKSWLDELVTKSGLVFLDGCDNLNKGLKVSSLIRRLLAANVRVAVSCREKPNKNLQPLFTQIALRGMTVGDSVHFFKRMGVEGTGLEKLCRKLQGHPLSLTLVLGMLRERNSTPEDILEQILESEQLGFGAVSRSLKTSLKQMQDQLSFSARELLKYLCTQDQPVLPDFEKSARLKDVEELQHSVEELVAYGLITVDRLVSTQKIIVHPMVREAFRDLREN